MKDWKLAIVSLLVGTCFIGAFPKRLATFAGPYRIIILKVTNESDEYKASGEMWTIAYTTQVRGKQPQYGWGKAYIALPLTDDMKIEIRVASRSNNEWKRNAFVLNFARACTDGLFHSRTVFEFIYGSDYDLRCPLKPFGYKEIKNRTIEMKFPKFPIVPYGYFRFTIAIMDKDGSVTRFLSVVEGHTVPRL